ncbi:oxidoreductase [Glomus cerebriforme]|uniref:3-dehydrosphinganine reductase n=1 Tax=Glomus cerebriforme TaxID=658196 RepID=A0A397T0A4_9GLOM|nr:oxidoreductase [Glomus cerebriforme]
MSFIDYIFQLTTYSELSEKLQQPLVSLLLLLFLTISYLMGNSLWHKLFGRNKFLPQGKHAYVTGGSKGLGKAVAKLLASKGAHVTIVARDKEHLQIALDEIKDAAKNREDYKNLIFTAISADVTSYEDSVRALNDACEIHNGRAPDFIFACAGACKPGLFVEQDILEFEDGMQLNYYGTLYTVHEGVKRMARQGIKGKIVLVSSILGVMSFIGFSQYSPTKYALKGLAETLRNELLLYDISVHCYFPGTIDSPGLQQENKTKPKVTSEIEGAEDAILPDQAAKALYKSLCRGDFHITSDLGGNICRVASKGPVSPTNNFIVDSLLGGFAWVGGIPFRYYIDKKVKDSKAQYPISD